MANDNSAPTRTDDESESHPLLEDVQDDAENASAEQQADWRRWLYAAHFLAAWNSRAFEFGAFLFLATIYPDSLLPASLYALVRSLSATLLSSRLGSYIDSADRLSVVRLSIVGQRVAVSLSCGLLFALVAVKRLPDNVLVSYGSLTALSVLACIEKLSAIANTISVERDWVVVIASNDESSLRRINSLMRRIDLFCKLVAPLFVSAIDSASSKVAIVVIGVMTTVTVLFEYPAMGVVHSHIPRLQAPKPQGQPDSTSSNGIRGTIKAIGRNTAVYIAHPAFTPSFALALLYLTVLSFGGQMIIWLASTGVPSSIIGMLRSTAAVFELSATWLGPLVMSRVGSLRAGIWFLNWQLLCVTCACIFFWLPELSEVLPHTDTIPVYCGAIGCIILSRLGLWGFDLSVQMILQEEVEEHLRGTFASQEHALQNIFETLAFASTTIFARPEAFKWPVTISACAVGLAAVLYASFVRGRRGHLLHLSKCVESGRK